MIYITGNTHGDINRFKTEQTKKFTSEDYLIICGDFGFIWNGGKKEEKQLEILSQKPYTILFVDGTHENFNLLNAYPTKRWNQGTVHEIRPNILHLMRGEIFGIRWAQHFHLWRRRNRRKRSLYGNRQMVARRNADPRRNDCRGKTFI